MKNNHHYQPNSPYKGLRPYTESDRAVFFAREREQETIIRNLITWRLTILYGKSGVGKSSLLRAGVAHYLHQTSQNNVNLFGQPGWAVIVFPNFGQTNKFNQDLDKESKKNIGWQNPLRGIKEQLKAEMESLGVKASPQEDMSLADTLKEWIKTISIEKEGGRLFIILDQFEEYFLARSELKFAPKNEQKKLLIDFDKAFSTIVNDLDLNVNFLISIQEESLSKLDYFRSLIKADLLKKRLELQPLNQRLASQVIEQPIAEYNRQKMILDSLQKSRMTIIYGGSNTCKSTLLRNLRDRMVDCFSKDMVQDLEKINHLNLPNFLFYNLYISDSFSWKEMKEKLRKECQDFVFFDQFEEYLLTRPGKAKGLLEKLPKLMQEFPNVNFLISLSTQWFTDRKQFQWLSKFEVFNDPKYFYLFKNNQGIECIAEGIVNPDDVKPLIKFDIEDQLVEDILEGLKLDNEPEFIDTSTLQVVMDYLWQEKITPDYSSYTLKAETFRNFAQDLSSNNWQKLATKKIIRKYCYENIRKKIEQKQLSYDDLTTASRLIYYLITPSGIKFSQTVQDLIEYGNNSRFLGESELTEEKVRPLLDELSRTDFPILRPVIGDRYEIFRPVLNETIRNWVQVDRHIKHLEQKAKNALQQFDSSQLNALIQGMEIGKKLVEIRDTDKSLFTELLGGVPPIINLALQKILDTIREKYQFKLSDAAISYYGVSFSEDDKKLAYGSLDGKVGVWELETEDYQEIADNLGLVYCVSLSSDGKKLVTATTNSNDNIVCVWQLEDKKPLGKFEHKEKERVYFVTFSPDGKQIVTASQDGYARLWDAEDDNKKSELAKLPCGNLVYFASFSQDGKRLATVAWGGDKSEVCVWDLDAKPKPQKLISFSSRAIARLVFNPNGQNLVTTSWLENNACLWDLQRALSCLKNNSDVWDLQKASSFCTLAFLRGAKTFSLSLLWLMVLQTVNKLHQFEHEGPVYFAQFISHGQQLVTAAGDGKIRRWDLKDPNKVKQLDKLSINKGQTYRASLKIEKQDHPKADQLKQLTTVTCDGMAHVWDLEKCSSTLEGKQLKPISLKPGEGANRGVYRLSFSSDGQQLASACFDGVVRLWHYRQDKWQQKPIKFGVKDSNKPHKTLYCVNFNHEGTLLASASGDGKVCIWDVEQTDKPQKEKDFGQKIVYFVSFSPDGQKLAIASIDGIVRLWNLKEDTIKKFPSCGSSVYCINFSPDGKKLATASLDGIVRLWDLQGNLLNSYLDHVHAVFCVSFSPDGNKLASASQDGTVRLWDLQGNSKNRCIPHEGAVFWVDFSPDGQQLATASQDGSVRLWDLKGNQIAEFTDHQNNQPIYCAIFSPDNQYLATASNDAVRLRKLESFDQMLTRGCHWLLKLMMPILTAQDFTRLLNPLNQ